MDMLLTADEVRVLGSLMEKEVTTPEYYPLSLNALVNACNQKSNRFPVVAYDEMAVARLVDVLREKRLVAVVTGGTMSVSRVPKYRQLLSETVGLDGKDAAILCELMVRGPQTAAQLRTRAERLHKFTDVAEVDAVIAGLMTRATPLAVKLPRQPGHKECRFAHLLSGAPAMSEASEPPPEPAMLEVRAEKDRTEQLKAEVESLRAELNELRQQFLDFKKQFTG